MLYYGFLQIHQENKLSLCTTLISYLLGTSEESINFMLSSKEGYCFKN